MTPRKLTPRGEAAREAARVVAAQAATRGRRKRTAYLPPQAAAMVDRQRREGPPVQLPLDEELGHGE